MWADDLREVLPDMAWSLESPTHAELDEFRVGMFAMVERFAGYRVGDEWTCGQCQRTCAGLRRVGRLTPVTPPA